MDPSAGPCRVDQRFYRHAGTFFTKSAARISFGKHRGSIPGVFGSLRAIEPGRSGISSSPRIFSRSLRNLSANFDQLFCTVQFYDRLAADVAEPSQLVRVLSGSDVGPFPSKQFDVDRLPGIGKPLVSCALDGFPRCGIDNFYELLIFIPRWAVCTQELSNSGIWLDRVSYLLDVFSIHLFLCQPSGNSASGG